jgi:uncharacterized protein YqhQ
MAKQTLAEDLTIRSIKILDIGYIGLIYFVLGILLARLMQNFFKKFDKKKEDKTGFFRQIIELILIIWLFSVTTYIIRNVAELIPSPFDGLYGFEHKLVKELSGASTFVFIFLYFQDYYKDKFTYLYEKYFF